MYVQTSAVLTSCSILTAKACHWKVKNSYLQVLCFSVYFLGIFITEQELSIIYNLIATACFEALLLKLFFFFPSSNQYDVKLRKKKSYYFASGALAMCVLS